MVFVDRDEHDDDAVGHIDDWSTFDDNDLLNVHVDREEYLVSNELISTFLPNIVDNHFHNLRLMCSLFVLNFEYNSQSFPRFLLFLIFDIELSIPQ